ncbi:MAG: galactosyltransferase-related protein [Cyanobacteria bacterium P01_D01_bin.105]
MRLSLITPYRDRLSHLTTQLAWWQQFSFKQSIEWIVIELTATPSDAVKKLLFQQSVQYLHLPCEGAFHKTKAMNLGLRAASGKLVAAFDVDLIPLGKTLRQHCELAEAAPNFLVTGYRLMAQTETVDIESLDKAADAAALGPEENPSALRKYLLKGERFGVMPLFWRDRLQAIHGWDEAFIGWGAEDQDLIERYLADRENGADRRSLCRCPDLTYLHLKHEPAADWNSEALTQKNRAYYYATKQQRSHRKCNVLPNP